MTFWQRVTIEDFTPSQSPTGSVLEDWAPPDSTLQDIEARVLPLDVTEEHLHWATPQEDAYEVQIRGGGYELRPRMRVRVGSQVYDVRQVLEPPPFGEPVTILRSVLVTP